MDDIFRALAHRERRIFISACVAEPRAAGDLARLSGLSIASVSEHLKVLRKTGLLRLSRRGRFWIYRTNVQMLDAAADAARALGRQPDGT